MKNKASIASGILIIIIVGLAGFNLNKKITREETIKAFCDNIDYFNVVKDYLLTKPKDYYISINTYKTEIEEPKVVEAVEFLIRNLRYKQIYNHSQSNDKDTYYIVFLRGGNNKEEFGIIYTKSKINNYGIIMELIEDNWYFHWMGYV